MVPDGLVVLRLRPQAVDAGNGGLAGRVVALQADAIAQCLEHCAVGAWKLLQRPPFGEHEEIILALNATDDPLHGFQGNRFFLSD